MKIPTRFVSLGLAAVVLGTAVVALTAGTPARPADAKSKVARGEYLVTVMGCGDCHTPGTLYGNPDFSRRLSGSEMGWVTPAGTAYARNLTPDMETGIGKWSEQEIVDALRTGMAPGGRALMPPMPWPNLTKLSDEDAYAVAAYLKSLPAISHKVPDRLPPGKQPEGSAIQFPPPPAWDIPASAPTGSK